MWEKREIRERQEHIVCPLQAPDHTCNEPKVKIFKEKNSPKKSEIANASCIMKTIVSIMDTFGQIRKSKSIV